MIRFFVLAFGEHYANLFEKIALRSLLQPGNRVEATVSVYSDDKTINRICDLAGALGPVESHLVNLEEVNNVTQHRAFNDEIGICVKENATMVVVSPDNFWSDGSLKNALAIMGEQDVSLAIPHMRVDQEKFLNNLPEGQISNAQLVRLSMENIHPSWRDADISKRETNSFNTGISMRQIEPNLYAVTHLLPTCFVCRFNAADYGFFSTYIHARGIFDHFWPIKLVESGRYRVVGSSDACFIAELTPEETHSTPVFEQDAKNPTSFYRTASNIEANRQFVSVWRAARTRFDNT